MIKNYRELKVWQKSYHYIQKEMGEKRHQNTSCLYREIVPQLVNERRRHYYSVI